METHHDGGDVAGSTINVCMAKAVGAMRTSTAVCSGQRRRVQRRSKGSGGYDNLHGEKVCPRKGGERLDKASVDTKTGGLNTQQVESTEQPYSKSFDLREFVTESLKISGTEQAIAEVEPIRIQKIRPWLTTEPDPGRGVRVSPGSVVDFIKYSCLKPSEVLRLVTSAKDTACVYSLAAIYVYIKSCAPIKRTPTPALPQGRVEGQAVCKATIHDV